METYDFVIIGGGIAGVTCCEQLIQIYNDKCSRKSIALISAHPLLKGVSRLQKVSQCLMDIEVAEYSSQQFQDRCATKHKKQYITLSIFIGTVTNIDHSDHIITFNVISEDIQQPQFQSVHFIQCLIASGGSPRTFKLSPSKRNQSKTGNSSNSSHSMIHVLRDSETVHHFSETMSNSKCRTVMVVGNGGISMEIVYALLRHDRGDDVDPLHIIWVIKHHHIGNTFLDEASSAFLIPRLFPKEDPLRNKKRMEQFKVFEDIESANGLNPINSSKDLKESNGSKKSESSNQQIHRKLGGAVGPRWTQNISRFAEQRPLWMDHTEIAEDEDSNGSNDESADNEQKETVNESVSESDSNQNEFPNELTLKMDCDVSAINKVDGHQLEVCLTNGEKVVVDHLLCAMGVTPNSTFCDDSVFQKTRTGEIVVNEYLETNIKGIFAAGDVCHVDVEDDDESWFQMKLWSQSQNMGWIAAHSMSCESVEEKEDDIELQFNFELFGHITRFFGRKCVFLGTYNVKRDLEKGIDIMMRVKPNEEFIKVVVRKGRVIGAVLIGDTDLEETMENLILNKTDISCYGDEFLKYDVDLEAMFD